MADPRWGLGGSASTAARIALCAALASCGGSSPHQTPDGGSPDGAADGPGPGDVDSGIDAAGAVPPATVGEACQQLNEAIAQRAARCSGGTLADWRTFEATYTDCAAYERHAAEGLVEYHREAWAACLQRFQAACTAPDPFPCQYQVLLGKVPDGQRCADFEVCGPTSGCIQLGGDACSGVCGRLAVENEPCGIHCGDGAPCFDGALCGNDLFCLDGTCTKSKGLGEACGGAQSIACAQGLFCDVGPAGSGGTGTCGRRVAGGACRSDDACLASEFCQAGTCAGRRTAGAPCGDAPTACVPWTSCATLGPQTCTPSGRLDQPCGQQPDGSFLQCLSGNCGPAGCLPPAATAGQSCGTAGCAPGSACNSGSGSGTCVACPSGGAPPPVDAGTACTDLANLGATVTEAAATGMQPAPAGGTVADGTYVLTKWEIYPPGSASVPAQHRITFRLTGTHMEIVADSSDNPAGVRGVATFTTAAASPSATIAYECGQQGSFTYGYTVTAGGMVLSDSQGNVQTYARQ
jgi:hypothetical protein